MVTVPRVKTLPKHEIYIENRLIYRKKNFVEALIDSLPEKTWSQYIDHPFVRGIAEGTLPIECFTHYLKQDYIYLKNYARAAALGAFKCMTTLLCYIFFALKPIYIYSE